MTSGLRSVAQALRHRASEVRLQWRRRRAIGRHRRTSSHARAARPSMVLVVLDALRADHLGCYGYGRETSPRLDRWSDKGLLWEQCVSTSSWTMPAFASLMTGLWPCRHKVVRYPNPPSFEPDSAVLPAVLKQAGYFTMAVTGGGYVSRLLGGIRGHFDILDSPGRRLEDTLPVALRYVEALGRSPFFLLLHGFNCHRPYEPAPCDDRFLPQYAGDFDVARLGMPGGSVPKREADIRRIVAAYDGEVRGVDRMIGMFLDRLKRLGVLANCLVIITSDHGEEFGEHGGFDHVSTLYDEVLHVPLIVLGPNVPAGRSDALASLADVFPSTLTWLGLPRPECDGLSLLERREGRMVLAETGYRGEYLARIGPTDRALKPIRRTLLRAGRTQRYKIILDHRDEPLECYDLAKDPSEKHSIVGEQAETVSALRRQFLFAARQVSAAEMLAAEGDEQPEDDEKVRETLRQLGYF